MISLIRKKLHSTLKVNPKSKYKYECIKICLIYSAIGFFWIYFSNIVANKFAANKDMLLIISIFRGWLYVAVTSIILYLLIISLVKKIGITEMKLNESYDEVSACNEELEALVQQLTASEEELRAQYDQIVESKEELIKSEERYKTLVNQMHQGLALFQGNVNEEEKIINFKLLDANESYEKLRGLKKKDSLGKTVFEIFPGMKKNLIEKFERVIKIGESIHYEHYVQERSKYYEVIAYRPKKLQLAIIFTDITVRKQTEKALKVSECTFRTLFESSSDAVFILGNNKVIDCNPAAIKLLGYDSKVSILGKSPCDFSPEKQPDGKTSKEKVDEIFKNAIENGNFKSEWWFKKCDGTLLPVETMLTSILLNEKKVLHSLCRDISERKQMEHNLEYLSYHDHLTNLYNRRFFQEELRRLDSEKNFPLTIVMADVNGLKLINDSFGHTTGDKLLRKVSEVMTKGCRAGDIIARLGGDEFVILLPKTDAHETKQIVKRIKGIALKEKVSSINIDISFGYATKKNEKEEVQETFKKAEDNMYKKKLLESPSMRGKTVKAIIRTLHEKNKREEQHSHRVSELCGSMGEALSLSEGEIEELKTIGLLHDIGKIAIEENILNKKGKLTEDEWEEIKRHPEIGYRILSTVSDMLEIAKLY